MQSRPRFWIWLALGLVLTFGLALPLWGSEILMTQGGFSLWLQQKLAPAQEKTDTLEGKIQTLEQQLQSLETSVIKELRLSPGSTQAISKVQGQETTSTLDVAPLIMNGRTMVPLRFVGEILQAEVIWEAATRQVIYRSPQREILLTVDRLQATVDGNSIQLDTAPVIQQGRTLVPLRFVSEWMGAAVYWEEVSRTVRIRYY